MNKHTFKFKLGERVFLLGRQGTCIVSGRGSMDYLSGGSMNLYQIAGAHLDTVPEYALLSEERIAAEWVKEKDRT